MRLRRGKPVLGLDEPGALGNGYQRAEVVEEVHEEEDEDDLQQALVERAANVELEGVAARLTKGLRRRASSAPGPAPRRGR